MTKITTSAVALKGHPNAPEITAAIVMECLGNTTDLVRLEIWAPALTSAQRQDLEQGAETMLRTFYLKLSKTVCPR